VFETEGPGHGIELTKRAIDDNCNLVLAAGGDGTINETLNGMMSASTQLPQAKMGIIPIGTGCDLGRHFGITEGNWLQVLQGGLSADIDVIEVKSTHDVLQSDGKTVCEKRLKRWCLNEVSFGISGNIVRNINLKKKHLISKQASYNMETLWNYLRLRNKEVYMQLGSVGRKKDNTQSDKGDSTDATNGTNTSAHVAPVANSKSPATTKSQRKPRIINQALCVCSNGSFFGAGMRVCPHADPVSGKLGITIFENVGIIDCVRILMAIRSREGIGSNKKVLERKSRELHAYPKDPRDKVYIEMDGEVFGRLPIHVKKIPRCLEFFLPETYIDGIKQRGIALHVHSKPFKAPPRVDSVPQYLVDVEVPREESNMSESVFLQKDNGGVPEAFITTTTVPQSETEDHEDAQEEIGAKHVVQTEVPEENTPAAQDQNPSSLTIDSVRVEISSPEPAPLLSEEAEKEEQWQQKSEQVTQKKRSVPVAEKEGVSEESNEQAQNVERTTVEEASSKSTEDAEALPQQDEDESPEESTTPEEIPPPQNHTKEEESFFSGDSALDEEETVETQETISPEQAQQNTVQDAPTKDEQSAPKQESAPTKESPKQEQTPTGPIKECSECHVQKESDSYSKTQWKKPEGARKCRECIAPQN